MYFKEFLVKQCILRIRGNSKLSVELLKKHKKTDNLQIAESKDKPSSPVTLGPSPMGCLK